jgi:hypothetical protein
MTLKEQNEITASGLTLRKEIHSALVWSVVHHQIPAVIGTARNVLVTAVWGTRAER